MSVFNDNNELKHPAFHDEKIEKKQSRAEKWDFWFYVSILFFLIALILFCILGD